MRSLTHWEIYYAVYLATLENLDAICANWRGNLSAPAASNSRSRGCFAVFAYRDEQPVAEARGAMTDVLVPVIGAKIDPQSVGAFNDQLTYLTSG